MQLKILSRRTLFIAILTAIVALLAAGLYYGLKNPTKSYAAPVVEIATASQKQTGPGLPVRLKIPRINIDAVIEVVGTAPGGAVDTPKTPDNVAWFGLGPRPGENGTAVINGHFGWKNDIPAAFDNLSELKTGDKIYVVDENGEATVFIVREIRLYNQTADTSDVFGSTDGKIHLNLITCEGVWSKVEKSYSNRLVVFADKE